MFTSGGVGGTNKKSSNYNFKKNMLSSEEQTVRDYLYSHDEEENKLNDVDGTNEMFENSDNEEQLRK